jgi:hypothetical protein
LTRQTSLLLLLHYDSTQSNRHVTHTPNKLN